MSLDVCTLGTSRLDPRTNVIVTQTTRGDESFGELPMYQCLGVTSVPWAPDDKGAAEGIVAEGVGGLKGAIIGGRDARNAKITGNAKPGDTIVHTTGPSQAAQLQLKEAKRQAVLATRDTENKQIVIMLDGNSDKVSIAAFGYGIQIARSTGISLTSANGQHGIEVTDAGVLIRGKVQAGGKGAPPGMCMAVASPATWAALTALAGPFTPVMGVTGGL